MKLLEHPEVLAWRRRFRGMMSRGEILSYHGLQWEGGRIYFCFLPGVPFDFVTNTARLTT